MPEDLVVVGSGAAGLSAALRATDAPETDPTWRGRIHWRRAQPPAFEEVQP